MRVCKRDNDVCFQCMCERGFTKMEQISHYMVLLYIIRWHHKKCLLALVFLDNRYNVGGPYMCLRLISVEKVTVTCDVQYMRFISCVEICFICDSSWSGGHAWFSSICGASFQFHFLGNKFVLMFLQTNKSDVKLTLNSHTQCLHNIHVKTWTTTW